MYDFWTKWALNRGGLWMQVVKRTAWFFNYCITNLNTHFTCQSDGLISLVNGRYSLLFISFNSVAIEGKQPLWLLSEKIS
jgi:hypothetical protein